MEPFVHRMITESKDLEEKIEKLKMFLNSVNNITNFEVQMLESQLDAMQLYQFVLDCRIRYYIKNKK